MPAVAGGSLLNRGRGELRVRGNSGAQKKVEQDGWEGLGLVLLLKRSPLLLLRLSAVMTLSGQNFNVNPAMVTAVPGPEPGPQRA